jgi:gliding motility-associated lipoprotein GldB
MFSACQDNDNLRVDVSNISANVNIIRFDKDYYGKSASEFAQIKKKYPYMFTASTPDSVWIAKMQDSLLLDLKQEVDKIFPNLDKQEPQIADLYKHIKYYYKDFKEPKILTLYSDWNYLRRAVFIDSIELLTLDNFLGSDNRIYKGIPNYIRQNLKPERIPVEIANSIIDTKVPPTRSKNLLHKMVNAGKKLFMLDAFLPKLQDSIKIGYTQTKMQWIQDNEEDLWVFFIENKLLYSTDTKLDRRFMNLAPYSKFYTEDDAKSPGRVGQYIGWQIVRSFMKKNKVSLQQLIHMDEEEIFKKSGYKPKK